MIVEEAALLVGQANPLGSMVATSTNGAGPVMLICFGLLLDRAGILARSAGTGVEDCRLTEA